MIVPGNNRVARPRWGTFFLGYHNMLASFNEAFTFEKRKLCVRTVGRPGRSFQFWQARHREPKNELVLCRPSATDRTVLTGTPVAKWVAITHRHTDNSRQRTHIALKALAFEQDSYQSAITPIPGPRAILRVESQLSAIDCNGEDF